MMWDNSSFCYFQQIKGGLGSKTCTGMCIFKKYLSISFSLLYVLFIQSNVTLKSLKIRLRVWTTHGDQKICLCTFAISLPVALQLDALSVLTYKTFVGPTCSMALRRNSDTATLVFSTPEKSLAYKNIQPLLFAVITFIRCWCLMFINPFET